MTTTKVTPHRESYKAFTWSVIASFQEAESKEVTIEATATPIPGYDLSKVNALDLFYLCREFQYMIELFVHGKLGGVAHNLPFPPLLLDKDFQPSELVFRDLATGKSFAAMKETLTVHRLVYPADIQTWVNKFNEQMSLTLTEIQLS